MSNVADYSEERAARLPPDLALVDDSLAEGVGDEMAAALARADPLPEPIVVARATGSPLEMQWARFRDQFGDAMEGTPHSLEHLEQRIFTGDAYFWPGREAAVVAQIHTYETGERDLQTLWAVGDLAEVLTLEPALAAAARLLGCSGVMVEGRAGWQRTLKPLGYEPWSVTVRKAL